MGIAEVYARELDAETPATKRVLERVPETHLAWRPHPKSMSLGQLALHVATLPGQISEFLTGDALDFSAAAFGPPEATRRDELLEAFAASLHRARVFLDGLTEARAAETWKLMAGDRQLFAAPRGAVVRSLLFNHWYHHRGQLLVYLRLLDVPVPSVYGPTADENPFAALV